MSYAWQFGDGTTANAVQVNKQYTAPGIYNVILTLTDSAGLVASSNRLINVFAPTPTMTPVLPPTPTPLPPTPTPLPTPTLTITPTLPPPVEPITPTVPPEIATLTPQVPVDPNATPTPTFDPNATPTVQLVGPTARFFAIVEGQRLSEGNEGGIPVVTVAPGVPITFNASESTGGSSEITQYYWDMGDGTPPISNNAVPPHTYGAEGRYIVTLTVTDANNFSSEARMIVDVRPQP